MQKYALIGDIDHYSLHNIFIISVITLSSKPSTYKLDTNRQTPRDKQIIYSKINSGK